MADDFIIHTSPATSERAIRGQAFISTFTSEVRSEFVVDKGFSIKDRGKTQPNGKSCLIASMVASARGMDTSTEGFETSVRRLYDKAESMGIVGDTGIPPIYQKEIAQLATELGMESKIRFFYPNEMSEDEIKVIAKDVTRTIQGGGSIAILIPSLRHWVLAHKLNAEGFQVFDPLTGADDVRTIDTIASSIGNIVGGEMKGEKRIGNAIILLTKESDFKFVRID